MGLNERYHYKNATRALEYPALLNKIPKFETMAVLSNMMSQVKIYVSFVKFTLLKGKLEFLLF